MRRTSKIVGAVLATTLALAIASTAHAEVPNTVAVIAAHKSANPASVAPRQKHRITPATCTAPAKSPFPCQRRR